MELKYLIPLVPLAVTCYCYYKFKDIDKYLDDLVETGFPDYKGKNRSNLYYDRGDFWDAKTSSMKARAVSWAWITVIVSLLVFFL